MKVSVISVNFNQTKVTLDLLHSINSQDYKDLEVIIVDNGSKEDPAPHVAGLYPFVKYVRSESNLGFAGGNNLGLQHATGDFLFFVNNDTEIPLHTIENLLNIFSRFPDSGVVCPLIYYYDQPELTQFAGYTPINTLTGRNHSVGYRNRTIMSEKVTESPFAHGAAMMVSRSVIERVGGMSENYFLYYEELDWGAAIRKAGFKIRVAHNAHILHKESVSTGKSSPLKTYFQTRNRILFMRRNYRGVQQLPFFLFFALIAFPKNILTFLIKRELEHLKSFLHGVWWNLRNQKTSSRIGYKYEFLRS